MKPVNIVLLEPEIPQNTGNIARTCAAVGAALHLIEPLGFSIDDRKLKRAGLDYWHSLDITYYKNLGDFNAKNPGADVWYFSTKARLSYTDPVYGRPVFLMFGRETAGLPTDLLRANLDRCLRIPMLDEQRSLNLSNAVAVALYEALRQGGFAGMRMRGEM